MHLNFFSYLQPPPKAQIRMTLKPSSGTLRANKNVIERLADDNMRGKIVTNGPELTMLSVCPTATSIVSDDEENGGGSKTPILAEDDSGSRVRN